MAHDKASRGVGLHDIATTNMVFRGKLAWQMYSKAHGKWCSIMQEKYLDSPNFGRIFTLPSPPWV